MDSTIKYDKVILVKELNDKLKNVGEVFEIANVLDNYFVLRDANSKIAIGTISFEDFERCFVHAENFKGWTDWQQMIGFDGQCDCMYRTNRRKTQVKFLTTKVRGESCCCKGDEFNLSFGVQMAYLRALNKAQEQKKIKLEEELKEVNHEIAENNNIMKRMISKLDV